MRVLRPDSLEDGRNGTECAQGRSAGDGGQQSPNGYFLPMTCCDREKTAGEKWPSVGVREACSAASLPCDPEQVSVAL